MAIAYDDLSSYVKGKVNGSYPDIGQVYYIVDSNFRTHAQGWSRADGTGPVDLYSERNPGYVFYAPGVGQPSGTVYASDRNAIQGAIDEMVDFRGDIAFFTPGSYSIATTSLAFDVPNARYLGPPVPNPRRSAVTITDAIGDNAVSVDGNEFGFITFVPLTAQNWFQVANGADGGYIHDCFYNADGITASTSTEFVACAATTLDWEFANIWTHIDGAQGDFATMTSPNHWYFHDMKFFVEGGTWASVFTFLTAPKGCLFDLIHFVASGASSLITNVFTGVTNSDNQMTGTRIYLNGTLTPTGTNIETGFGTATDLDIAECYLTGDATGEGGVLITLA